MRKPTKIDSLRWATGSCVSRVKGDDKTTIVERNEGDNHVYHLEVQVKGRYQLVAVEEEQ